jgi:hypothetical protein
MPERRFHAVGNALQVLQGALSALAKYGADLRQSDKDELERSIGAACSELEALLDGVRVTGPDRRTTRSLDRAVERARARGVDVRFDGPERMPLHGDGEELTTLLTEFLSAACGSAGGTVEALPSGAYVSIEVVTGPIDGSARRLSVRLRGR